MKGVRADRIGKWRKCDHPRTPANTTGHQCKACHRIVRRRHATTDKGRATQARVYAKYAATLGGMWTRERADLKYQSRKKGNLL